MEPIEYLSALRRRWPVILAAVAVAVAAGWATTETVAPAEPEPTRYRATAVLWNSSASTVGTGSTFPISSMVRLATLPDVVEMAAQELGWQEEPLALLGQVSVQVDPQADAFLNITGSAETPHLAERIAEAFSGSLIDYLQGLETRQLRRQARTIELQLEAMEAAGATPEQLASLEMTLHDLTVRQTEPVPLAVLQAPRATEIPSTGFQAPQSRAVRLAIAAAIGLLAGLALALVLERFDTKIRTRRSAKEHFGLPVLAEVPVLPRRQRRGVAVARRSTGAPADAFRLLAAGVATRLRTTSGSSDNGDNGRERTEGTTVLVTSPGPSDGKTVVSANLAAAFGEMGRRVLLISCDLRRPTIHRTFNVPVSPGLVDLLGSNGSPNGVSPYTTHVRNVAVLPSGIPVEPPGELLASPMMGRVLREARRVSDVVVLDTSPLLVGNDVTAMLAESDAVVLVARANKTTAEIAERAREVLDRLGAPVVGIALNRAREISMPGNYRRAYSRRTPAPRKERTPGRADLPPLPAPPTKRSHRRGGFPRLSRHRSGS